MNYIISRTRGGHKLTQAETNELILKTRQGDLDARNKLVQDNLGLCIKSSSLGKRMQYDNHRIEQEDCFQEAIFGLMTAIDYYEPERGLMFSTYAMWWIRQSVIRYVYNNRTLIRVPIGLVDLQVKYQRLKVEHDGKEEDFYLRLLAFESNLTVEQVVHRLRWTNPTCTDVEKRNEDGDLLHEVEDITALNFLDRLSVDQVEKIASLLPARDRNILFLRVKENWTLEAIAEMIGLTRERVRQIEHQALAKLKAMVNKAKRRGTWKAETS